MGLEIGDKVIVKSTLEVGGHYGKPLDGMTCYFAHGMNEHKGKLATIIEIANEDRYKLKFDDMGISLYFFTEDMLIKQTSCSHTKLIKSCPCFKLSLNSIDISFVKTENGFGVEIVGEDIYEYEYIDNMTMESLDEFIYDCLEGEFK